jgi:hypothetical protein
LDEVVAAQAWDEELDEKRMAICDIADIRGIRVEGEIGEWVRRKRYGGG